ncbi:glyoxylase-like metal-dependent hydrolase (beta-lactamase superfamily II) [Ochrobactrum sp. 19YEA23]|uniref:MBL fold metallo-hydrolase n=1 Tax=Ochrobactrum sp. 19YEA23 TaxID=3039854 RepID=UPI00247B0DED|nr:glyoxylase-like metal-dependent hydrolase (beta-lactamase superfamily II) [Ochrobactrum sp. 19YEA23]
MPVSRRTFAKQIALAPAVLAAPALLRLGGKALAKQDGEMQISHSQRRVVGEIEVIALMDGVIQRPPTMMPGYDEDEAGAAAKRAHHPHSPDTMALGINAFVIRTRNRVIAVDTGSPAGLAPTLGNWHAALAAAGIHINDIDTIFLTHLHPDHVGGMTDVQTGTARFPEAEVIASETDWQFTHDEAVYGSSSKEVREGLHISRAKVAPYDQQKRLIKPDAEIAPGLRTMALPGHTPGHIGLRVDSGNESLLFWGDVLIAPAYQFANPDWAFALDTDRRAAAATRKRILDMVATDKLMVAGAHLDFPGFGYVDRAEQGYRFVSAPWDYRI